MENTGEDLEGEAHNDTFFSDCAVRIKETQKREGVDVDRSLAFGGGPFRYACYGPRQLLSAKSSSALALAYLCSWASTGSSKAINKTHASLLRHLPS